MNHRLLIASAVALVLAAILWFSRPPHAPKQDVASVATLPSASPVASAAAVIPAEPDRTNAQSVSLEARPDEVVVDESTALGRRLDEIAARLEAREFRDEADRLLARWMMLDTHAALAWLDSHRGDVRFDRLVANAAHMYIAAGDLASAQHLAGQIVESSTRDWVNEEVWSMAYERRLVSAEDLKNSGLSQKALDAIGSGSRRD